VEDVLIVRRSGLLRVGDVMSLLAASAPRRGDAFGACQEGVGRLKEMKTLEKIET